MATPPPTASWPRSPLRLETGLRDGDIVARLDKAMFAIALAPVRRLDLESMIQLAARLQAALPTRY